MVLTEKEMGVIKDLQTQEQACIDKYKKFANDAKDPVLKELFKELEGDEREHFETLGKILSGNVPECDCNDTSGRDYEPTATYGLMGNQEDMKADCFLATDAIGSEKMVSSEYNTNVFAFGDSGVRKVLADIQIEEQNHAEMLYKYKTVNGMK